MRDKITICNTVVSMAADLMEAQMLFNECVIEQFLEKPGNEDRVARLTEQNNKTRMWMLT